MAKETKNVVKVPEVTPELIAENQAIQDDWRKRFEFTPQGIDQYAERVIKDNLLIIDTLVAQRSKLRGERSKTLTAKIHVVRDETAEWLVSIGQFEEAVSIVKDPVKKKLYKEFVEAEAQDDDKWCDCPKWKEENGVIQQNYYVERQFQSHKYARKIAMLRCNECGFRNAQPKPDELKRLSAHRAKANSLVKDASPADRQRILEDAGMMETDLRKIVK